MTSVEPSLLYWVLGIVIGLPLVIVVLTETLARLRRRHSPLARAVENLRTLFAPALAFFFFLRNVVQLPTDNTLSLVAQSAVWIFGLMAVLNVINDVVFGEASPESWRSRVPSLFRDFIRLLLVAIGGSIVYSQVWGMSLGGAVAALGLTSIVLGLALQEPLGNMVSGLMLLFERPISLGDWVNVDGVGGQVVQINWRSVHIKTFLDGVRIVPNSELYKKSFNNLSRPNTKRHIVVDIGFSYDHPPNHVKSLLTQLLKEVPGVLADPEPKVRVAAYADFSINYSLVFAVASSDVMAAVRDEVMTRIWYLSKRNSLEIPYPIATQIEVSASQMAASAGNLPLDSLTALPAFAPLLESKLDEQLEAGLKLRKYAAGEILITEGSRIEGLHVITEGTAVLSIRAADGLHQELARLQKGEYFGESSIVSGTAIEVTVTAVTDLELVVISPEGMYRLLGKIPHLSRQLGEQMNHRNRAVSAARRASRRHPGSLAPTTSPPSAL